MLTRLIDESIYFSLFVVVALIAMVACVIGTEGGHLLRSIDKKINSKLQRKGRR